MSWLRIITMGLVGAAVALAIIGASYEVFETGIDLRRFPQEGKSVDVGGYKLNLNCTGAGSPTVVLESGLESTSFTWKQVQPGIAAFPRVCSYDRAGYMWSDYSPLPRTSRQIARELHALLANAGEKPPFVLVGHSFGGLDIRVFNGMYPNEVAGMVLPESTHPDLLDRLPAGFKILSDKAQKDRERDAFWAPILYRLGIARFRARREIEDMSLPYGDREYAYLSVLSKFIKTAASEAGALEESGAEVRAAGTLGDKPLIVLTAEKGVLGLPITSKDLEQLRDIWINDLQVQLVHLSTRGKRIMLPDSDHGVPWERPDAIISAVKEVWGDIQTHSAVDFEIRTIVTEHPTCPANLGGRRAHRSPIRGEGCEACTRGIPCGVKSRLVGLPESEPRRPCKRASRAAHTLIASVLRSSLYSLLEQKRNGTGM